MILLWLTAGVLGQASDAPPVIETSYGSGPFTYPKPHYRLEDDEERDELRREIIKIGTAPRNEIITGIVQAEPRTKRAANIETLARMNAERLKSEAARAETIKRLIAQDDEWLMMA